MPAVTDNRSQVLILTLLIAAVAGDAFSATPGGGRAQIPTDLLNTSLSMQARGSYALANFAALPLRFEPNYGKPGSPVRYVTAGAGFRVGLAEHAAVVELAAGAPSRARLASLRLRLVDANQRPILRPEGRLDAVSNYFIGNNPAHWRQHVANYRAVRYRQVYPGIDWVFYGNGAELEYDFVIAPGGDPAQIRLRIDGADRLRLAASGELLIEAAGRVLRQRHPIAYQASAGGGREYIDGQYVIDDARDVRIALGPYDARRELIIDPALAFSTYLGGSVNDAASAIAIGADGSVYVAGVTSSPDFPTLDPLQATNRGNNVFIAKLNAAGNGLIFSTYLGGTVQEQLGGIAVDSAGDAYVAGTTSSPDFPVRNAFQMAYKGQGPGATNGFVTKLDSTGQTLVYSTYLGGSKQDIVHGLAIDGTGAAYVVGETESPDFPVANSIQATLKGRINAFASKLSADGSSLIYSTYLGGSAADEAMAIRLDSSGAAYIAGSTNSLDFPTANPFQSVNRVSVNGNTNPTGFVAKLNAAGTAVVYASYLGGSGFELVYGLGLDAGGNAYVVGQTGSTDFPTVNALQDVNKAVIGKGGGTGFVTKINAAGSALVYSTYLGGSGGGNGLIGDSPLAIAVDGAGNAFVAGRASSTDFPTVEPVQSDNLAAAIGATNAFVSELNENGDGLIFSTYLGGHGSWGNAQAHTTIPFGDSATAIAVDSSGNIYVAGQTGSMDFPTLNPFQTTNGTSTQYGSNPTAFVAKFGTEVDVVPPPTTGSGGRAGGGGALGWESLIGLGCIFAANVRRKLMWTRVHAARGS